MLRTERFGGTIDKIEVLHELLRSKAASPRVLVAAEVGNDYYVYVPWYRESWLISLSCLRP